MIKVSHNSVINQWLFQCLLSIRDPRVRGRCTYPLINILIIALCGIICGANTWEAIAEFGMKRFRWLNQFIDMSCGVLSPLTFARVFSLIRPEEFQRCLILWMSQFFELLKNDIINIDGKSLRGSARKSREEKATHIVSAYLAKEQATLAEERVPDKTNEIRAIPILLKNLQIQGCIITIDAMGTQKGIANLACIKQANYVLALKENHKRFYRHVERTFLGADQINYQEMVCKTEKTKNYGHGRIEERTYTLLPMMYFYKYKKDWRDLQSILRIQSARYKNGEIEKSTRYYITSLPFNQFQRIIQATRQHWAIENELHWKLDVGLAEDACQVTRGYADQNLATLRKMVLKLLEKESSSAHGIAAKRLQAALSTKYLRKVVGF